MLPLLAKLRDKLFDFCRGSSWHDPACLVTPLSNLEGLSCDQAGTFFESGPEFCRKRPLELADANYFRRDDSFMEWL